MSWLLTSPPSTFAEEQLHQQLSALSTLPVNFAATSSVSARKPSPALENALHRLGGSVPVKRDELIAVLKALAQEGSASTTGFSQDDGNAAIEVEVVGRAVTMVWKEVIQALIDSALELEEERGWWDRHVNSRRQIATYLLQSELDLPLRCSESYQARSASTAIYRRRTERILHQLAESLPFPLALCALPAPSQRLGRAHIYHLAIHPHAARNAHVHKSAHISSRQYGEAHRYASLRRTRMGRG